MPRLSNHAAISRLAELYATFPDPFLKVSPLGEAVMRNVQSPFTPAEQEMIAAYVSVLNGCRYCYGIHAEVAKAFGMDAELLAAIAENPEAAPVEPRMRPVLAYARQLTEAPARATDAQAEAIREAGWDDRAVVFTVATTAYFNMMNRLVEGFGLTVGAAEAEAAGIGLKERGYLGVRDAAARRAGISPGD